MPDGNRACPTVSVGEFPSFPIALLLLTDRLLRLRGRLGRDAQAYPRDAGATSSPSSEQRLSARSRPSHSSRVDKFPASADNSAA